MKALFLASLILVHGWYPIECCGGQDCRPVACESLISSPDGSVTWLGLHFVREMVRNSKDRQCHVCVAYERLKGLNSYRIPLCVFLSPTT
jgi:hypothetical protein